MTKAGEDYLGHASSDESDRESGYDSEAAEVSKSTKSARNSEPSRKRRKLSHSSESDGDVTDTDEEADSLQNGLRTKEQSRSKKRTVSSASSIDDVASVEDTKSSRDHVHKSNNNNTEPATTTHSLPTIHNGPDDLPSTIHTTKPSSHHKSKKPTRPGVIYLSSLPPHLRPSALRNLLAQRGFSPISKLFLTPLTTTTTSSSTSKSSSRKLYTEGWLEFPSHRTAKLCAETLNATPVGGKKGGYYRDDLWNMRYLRGMQWGELMAGVAGERREEEAKRDEERREILGEQKRFVEGVVAGRKWEGKREKERRKEGKGKDEGGKEKKRKVLVGGGEEVQRTWRQFEVKKAAGGGRDGKKSGKHAEIDQDVREVLGKIF